MRRFSVSLGLVTLLLPFSLVSGQMQSAQKQEEEFPNYFSELHPDDAQNKIHEALDSILRRLQVPYAETGNIRNDGFFLKLNEKLLEKDPHAQAYISGGVVRSLLGYIYKKIYSAKQKDPKRPVGEILDKLIKNSKDVPTLSALGIGSDMDILVDSPKGPLGSPVKRDVDEFIGSAEKTIQLVGQASKFKNTLIPQGDVNDYHTQTSSTTSQGGSSLDWLAYPLPKKNGEVGEIREPDGTSRIMKRFLAGQYDYLPPPAGIEAKDKQTIRGLRPLLEMPFLNLSPAGEAQMQTELSSLKEKLNHHEPLSPAALEQFGKATRNARFEGGHNRFHFSDNLIEKTAGEISLLSAPASSAPDAKKLPLIPEFLGRKNPLTRKHKELPHELQLTPVTDFIQKYTENGEGALFHGTPNLEVTLNVIRNGLVTSNSRQGTAKFGAGAYTTGNYKLAASYAQEGGVVLQMPVRKELNPRILNLDDPKIAKSLALEKIREEALAHHKDLNEFLAQEYGIDIILHQHVLVQNAAVLKTPKNMKDLIDLAAIQAKNAAKVLQNKQSHEDLKKLKNFASYCQLAHALQIEVAETPSSLARPFFSNLEGSTDKEIKLASIGALSALLPGDLHVQGAYARALKDSDPEVQSAAAFDLWQWKPHPVVHAALIESLKNSTEGKAYIVRALSEVKPTTPAIQEALLEAAMNDPDQTVQHEAKSFLRSTGSLPPHLKNRLYAYLKHPDPEKRARGALFLGSGFPDDPKVHAELFELLVKDVHPAVREAAASGLSGAQTTDENIHHALLKAAFTDPDDAVKWEAKEAFIRIRNGTPGFVEMILKALDDPNVRVRVNACNILERFHSLHDSRFQYALLKAVKDNDQEVRFRAFHAAVKIHPMTQEIYQALSIETSAFYPKRSRILSKLLSSVKPPETTHQAQNCANEVDKTWAPFGKLSNDHNNVFSVMGN